MAFIKINGKQIADGVLANNHISPTAAISETKLDINWNSHTETLQDKKVIYKVQINDKAVGSLSQLNVSEFVTGVAVTSIGTSEGILTDAPKNKVILRDGDTQDSPFKDEHGHIVYGRMVYEGGAFLVKFYTDEAGVETPYTMEANKNVDLVYYKRTNLLNVPEDYAITDGGSFVEGVTDVIAEFNLKQVAADLGITLNNDGNMSLNRSILDEILVQTRGVVNENVRANETIDEVVTARGVAVNLNARLTNIETSVSTEQSRAEAAEGVLQDNIDSEESARIAAVSAEEAARIAGDTTLQSNIDSEAATRLSADNTLQSNITSEASARLSGDQTLQTNLDTEEQARIAGDQAIRDDLASDSAGEGASLVSVESGSGLTGASVQDVLENLESRLASQESGGGAEVTATHTRDAATTNGVFAVDTFANLEERIVDIEVTVDSEVKALEDALAAEQLRAETAEAGLASDLADEVARATAAEGVLTSDLASEVSRATAAEAQLTSDLSDEVTRATAAESTLTTNLASEVSRATAAEAVLTSDLASEVARATAAEADLASDIATEQTRAELAEAGLASDIAAEQARAEAAEASLASDLADEVSDRIAAVSAEQTARENADQAITDRIDVSLNPDGTLIAGTQIHDHAKYVFAAIGGETSVNMPTGVFFQVGDDSLDVYINGVLQAEGYHYTEVQDAMDATKGTGIDFSPETLVAGDIVILKWYTNNAS